MNEASDEILHEIHSLESHCGIIWVLPGQVP